MKKITPELLAEWEQNPGLMEAFLDAVLEKLSIESRRRDAELFARMMHGTGQNTPRGILSVEQTGKAATS